MTFRDKIDILFIYDYKKGDFVMSSKFFLNVHMGYRSSFTLVAGERVLKCNPGDLHELSVRNVGNMIRLLDCGAVSHTGLIKAKGHEFEENMITIQKLPAIRLEDRTITSEDIRNIQAQKAKAVSSVLALLAKAGVNAADVEVNVQTVDGSMEIGDAERVGILPVGFEAASEAYDLPETEAELVDLEEPGVLNLYTQNLFFPKK